MSADAVAVASGDGEAVPVDDRGRGLRRLRPSTVWMTVGIVAVLGLAYLLPLPALFHAPGPAMEEGFMLVFPDRFLHGDIPNRDFLNLYGPGSVWVLAAVYKLFGTTVFVERTVGLLQLMATSAVMMFLVRRWGRSVSLTAGLLSVLFGVSAIGLIAVPWSGGVALGLGGIVALARAREPMSLRRPDRATVWAFSGGVLAGFALLYRLDLGLAIVLGAAALLWRADGVIVRRWAAGFGLGLAPYVLHVILAGPANVWNGMIVEPMLYLRATRHLEVPPDPNHLVGVARIIVGIDRSWPLPRLTAAQQLTAWFLLLVATTLGLVVVSVWAIRKRPTAIRPRLLLAASLFCVGLLPQAVQRADSAHLGWVSSITIGLIPCAIVEIASWWRPRWRPARVGLVAGAVTLVVIVVLLPTYVARRYISYAQDSIDGTRVSTEVTHDGRSFLVGADGTFASSLRTLLRDADAAGRPNDRLIVATSDLRRTPYIDSYLYHLLPKYRPGTRFIEMEPGITNRSGTPLTDELRRADIVIVSSRWSGWDEPNDSMKPGDPRPAAVFRRDFCRAGEYGNGLSLYTRCRARD